MAVVPLPRIEKPMFTAKLPGACAALSKLRKVTAAVLLSLPGPKRATLFAPTIDLVTLYGPAPTFLRTSTTFQVPRAVASTNSPLLLIDSASAITTPRRR
ncbi:hypothetical protein D3C81_992400 [compost metagenome]